MGSESTLTHAKQDLAKRDLDLDFLRGLALLGIVLINIRGFASSEIAMVNPTILTESDSWGRALWSAITFLAQTKSMNLFAILMGYSYFGFCKRWKECQISAYSRMASRYLVLLVIGLVHLFVFYWGDVLVLYSLGALLLYPLLRARWQINLALSALAYFSAVGIAFWLGIELSQSPEKLQFITDFVWQPQGAARDYELRTFSAQFIDYLSLRLPYLYRTQLIIYPTLIGPQFVGAFLLGITTRQIEDENPTLYARLKGFALALLGLGLALCAFGLFQNERYEWHPEYSLYFGANWNYIGAIFASYGFFLMIRGSFSPRGAYQSICKAGRLSLTHYLCQSMICAALFYGWGLGYYAQLSYFALTAIALGIWLSQIFLSTLYFRYFELGPFEALVRGALRTGK
jgi:uncharacterized protein